MDPDYQELKSKLPLGRRFDDVFRSLSCFWFCLTFFFFSKMFLSWFVSLLVMESYEKCNLECTDYRIFLNISCFIMVACIVRCLQCWRWPCLDSICSGMTPSVWQMIQRLNVYGLKMDPNFIMCGKSPGPCLFFFILQSQSFDCLHGNGL